MKFIDMQYLNDLAESQSLAIGERFEMTEKQISELKMKLLFFYEQFLEKQK